MTTSDHRLSRRSFLAASAGAAAACVAGWLPAFEVPASAQSTIPAPPEFPVGIRLYQQAFENWSEEISLEKAWTCAPASAADVVTLANWAYAHGYEIRARGKMHAWSPLTIPVGSNGAGIILADTTQSLTAVVIDSASTPATVTAQTGITMDRLLQDLEDAGLGLTAHPAPGDVTLGGILAVDGHGAAIPAVGESRSPGHTYGSISNLILSLRAVVWNGDTGRYELRSFARNDPAIQPFLTHLGRTFVTDVTLQVGANSRMRCQSFTHIPVSELFGPQGSGPRTFATFLEQTGRVEAIWYPFNDTPWLKVWSLAPTKPAASRAVSEPYNYTFADVIPQPASDLAREILTGNGKVTPDFAQVEYTASAVGLEATVSADIWGWAKNVLLYVKPSTLRFTANGYAVLTSRDQVQSTIHEFTSALAWLLSAYQAEGAFPLNGPVEIRVTGLDTPLDVDVPGARSPQLSALRPRPDHPEWDVAVWFDVLTMPGTPKASEAYRGIEQWLFTNFDGPTAMVRPEWSKGWAYSTTAAWSDPAMLSKSIPDALRAGQADGDDWDSALAALAAADPHRVFTNGFLNAFLT
ncbi:MAG TPA: cholesterol oxidase substrate-binding domain-containing protein [Acidimicrobiales bacterium]|jgi:FAD/FMN-containing dehydrogenase|nr:cholesterol oxidase substrate-binding domain-containing protein [Acidimicrobiales bacterium]